MCFALSNMYCINNRFDDFVSKYITKLLVCVSKDSWRVGLSSVGLRSALCPRMCR